MDDDDYDYDYDDYDYDYDDYDYYDDYNEYDDEIYIHINDEDVGDDGIVKITGVSKFHTIIIDSEKSIKKIIIGKDVTDIDFYYVFDELRNRGIRFEFEEGNPQYKIVDDVIYSIDGRIMYGVLPYKEETEFIVPQNVEEIMDGALAYYKNLEEITLNPKYVSSGLLYGLSTHENIRRIIVTNGENSSYKFVDGSVYSSDGKWLEYVLANDELTSYTLSPDVEKVRESAFRYLKNLKEMTWNNNVEEFGALNSNSLVLDNIKFLEDNTKFKIENGCILSKDGKTLYKVLNNESNEIFYVPDSVEKIADNAFKCNTVIKEVYFKNNVELSDSFSFFGCHNLEKVELPPNITRLNNNMFSECRKLRKLEIPDSVTSLGYYVFNECKLDEIVIPESVVDMSDIFFGGISRINKIVIKSDNVNLDLLRMPNCKEFVFPKNIKRIPHRFFADNDRIRNVEFPEGVTELAADVFAGCELDEIVIPESVTEISPYFFDGIKSVKKIVIKSNKRDFASIENIPDCEEIVFPDDLEKIPSYFLSGNIKLKKVTLPKNLKVIDVCAFSNCTSLEEIILPEGIKVLEDCCFEGCENLKKIVIPDSVEDIGENVLRNCEKLEYVECGIENRKKIYERLRAQGSAERVNERAPLAVLFGEELERVKNIKERCSYLRESPDYLEKTMNLLLFSMIHTLGIDEAENLLRFPNIEEEDLKKYGLLDNETFNNLYEMKCQLKGDIRVTLDVLKFITINFNSKKSNEKNGLEIKIIKKVNEKLENGYEGTFESFLKEILKEVDFDITLEDEEKITAFQRSLNKYIINERIENGILPIEEALTKTSEKYPEPIVHEQIRPIKVMVESVLKNLFINNGKIDRASFEEELFEKISHANADYIRMNKNQIVENIMEIMTDEKMKEIGSSILDSVNNIKNKLGKGWKYKLNQALDSIGYSFDRLPKTFFTEDIKKMEEMLNIGEIDTKSIAFPTEKDIEDRKKLILLLETIDFPLVMTYQKIHDMFSGITPQFSESFFEFFKQNKEEILRNNEFCQKFSVIHDNFDAIVTNPHLRNLYEHNKLSVEQIVTYIGDSVFINVRPGNEKLAKLSSSVANVMEEKDFEFVQDVFEITKRRERTSIPPVKVHKSKFRGRMLSPDDVLNLFVGNITTCCQKFGDVGEASMLLGAIEENAGIFVIEELDENGNVINIIGQSLTIRQKGKDGNKDRLTFDNIEIDDNVLKRLSSEDHKEILSIYQEAGKQAIEKDKEFLGRQLKKGKITQQQYDSLVLKEVVAGTGYNNLDGLLELKNAQIISSDEAWYKYKTMKGHTQYPWIDSAGGETPNGSPGIPKIIAQMDEEERKEIDERNEDGYQDTKLSDVEFWYGKVGEVKSFDHTGISEYVIEKIKTIESVVYRKEQQLMNEKDVTDIVGVETAYGISDPNVKLGSNDDWYIMYSEKDKYIDIADFAVVGATNSRRNGEIKNSNSRLAIAEATNELYGLIIDAAENNKEIYCNATTDTSLVNIKRLMQKGLIKVKSENGRNIILQGENGKIKKLVYEDGTDVELRNWNSDSDIKMLYMQIIPDVEKMKVAKVESEEFLKRVQTLVTMKGKEKEEGLDELRDKIRRKETVEKVDDDER